MIEAYKFSKHTGKFWPILIFIGFPGTILIALLYAFFTWYISNQILSVIMCFLYFSAWAGLLGKISIKTKCRNPKAIGWSSLLLAIICFFVNWIMFLNLYHEESPAFLTLFTNPGLGYQLVAELANSGRFTYNEEGLSATVHNLIWIAEAMVMVVLAPLSSSGSIAKKVFCEKCGNWMEDSDDFNFPIMSSDKGTIIPKDPEFVIHKDKNDTLQVNPRKIPSLLDWFYYRAILPTSYLKVKLRQCSHCHQTSIIQLDVVDVSVTEEQFDYSGAPIYNSENTRETTHQIRKQFLISNDLYGHFLKKKAAYDDSKLNPWVLPPDDDIDSLN